MNCKDNLDKCQASCCKLLVFDKFYLKQEEIEYYQTHGCKIERGLNRGWRILVPMKCPQLENNLCKIQDTKPKLCSDMCEKTKSKYYLTEGCVLK